MCARQKWTTWASNAPNRLTRRHAARLIGPVKATEAADAWAMVLDRMEEAWKASSKGDSIGASSTAPVPPLRVFMRLGALYTTLGRIEEAKVRGKHALPCFLCAGKQAQSIGTPPQSTPPVPQYIYFFVLRITSLICGGFSAEWDDR